MEEPVPHVDQGVPVLSNIVVVDVDIIVVIVFHFAQIDPSLTASSLFSMMVKRVDNGYLGGNFSSLTNNSYSI